MTRAPEGLRFSIVLRRSLLTLRGFSLAWLLFAQLLSGVARAERPRYDLALRVDPAGRDLSGLARITFINQSTVPLHQVLLWRYPDRFAVRSAALNDFNFYWVYPARFNPSTMRIVAARAWGQPVAVELGDHRQAGPRTLLKVVLPRPLQPGEGTTLEIDFNIRLPERYGAFGCHRGTCILSGGFYPMLPPFCPSGFDLNAPPARADFDLSLSVPFTADVLIQGEHSTVAAGATRRIALVDVRAPVLVVGRPRYRTEVLLHRGVRVVYHVTSPRPVKTPPDFVVPYWPPDRAGRVLSAARQAIDLVAGLGLPLPAGGVLHLFDGALRTEVALALPGAVLVSDRAFDVFPMGPFLLAHERALVRAIFDEYVEGIVGPFERPMDEGWAPDVAASFLTDRYAQAAAPGRSNTGRPGPSTPRETVARVGFLPAADKILYAPQVPFATAYFYTLADPDPLRDNLAQFNNDWPRGRTLYAKLLDLLGEQGVERIARDQLGGMPVRAAAEAAHGGPLDWFFAQWLGPYPSVDYRFREVRTTREGGRFKVSLIVEKIGPQPPVEPVEVQVRDREGRAQSQIWDGRGREHHYLFVLDAAVSVIQLDPRGRLTEELPGSNDDLKFGERLPSRWKFILGSTTLSAGTGTVNAEVNFSLSRVRDLKNSLRFTLLHNELNTIAVTGLYTRWFGPKANPGRLGWNVSAGLTAARVPALGAAGTGNAPGAALTTSASLAWDDRLYLWEPIRAHSLSLSASYTLTVLDNGMTASRGDAAASWQWLTRLHDGHGLALQLSSGIVFGDIAAAQQLISSGGPTGLRGFSQGELLGLGSLLGRVEYRHVFVHSLNLNLMSTYYLRGLSGALFAEAGITTGCQSYAIDSSSPAVDVGYGLNFIADWFGLAQDVIGFSVAVPLVRPDRDCFGMHTPAPGRSPVVFLLNFGPPW